MMVMGELDEPFLPLPDDLLVSLQDSRPVIEALLDNLPASFSPPAANQGPDSAMGPALQAAFLAMSSVGGKLLLFQHSAASLGPGKTKARENLQLYGTGVCA
jgi:protein transport protein SEC24